MISCHYGQPRVSLTLSRQLDYWECDFFQDIHIQWLAIQDRQPCSLLCILCIVSISLLVSLHLLFMPLPPILLHPLLLVWQVSMFSLLVLLHAYATILSNSSLHSATACSWAASMTGCRTIGNGGFTGPCWRGWKG